MGLSVLQHTSNLATPEESTGEQDLRRGKTRKHNQNTKANMKASTAILALTALFGPTFAASASSLSLRALRGESPYSSRSESPPSSPVRGSSESDIASPQTLTQLARQQKNSRRVLDRSPSGPTSARSSKWAFKLHADGVSADQAPCSIPRVPSGTSGMGYRVNI
jgi:hypothetical protein